MISRRLARVAPLAASAMLAVGLAFAWPTATAVLAHAQLVASDPAAGDVVAVAPTEIRLVFSEPISAIGTSLDLLGPDGSTLAAFAGSPDPADPYTLVAPAPALGDGIYTVEWRSLSSADGHSTSGAFTFGVGDVAAPSMPRPDGGGAVHAGHDAGTAVLETESRILGNLGLLLALGLPIVGWLVLRRTEPVGLARATAGALVLAGLGAAGLLWLSASSAGISVIDHAGDRNGALSLARATVASAAAVIVLVLARSRPRPALAVGGLAGLIGLILLAAAGHAAAYASPAPLIAIVIHLVAAAMWLSGLLALAWVATLGEGPSAALTMVPRFSAIALVAVAFIGLTGIYSDWVQTRDLVAFDTPYTITLAIKIALALAAFTVGALNYLGVRPMDFRSRIILESGLAIAVLVATGVLASGSPPGQERPVAIAPATSSAGGAGPTAALAVAPGRPGPTRFVVTMPTPLPHHETVELALSRLDEPAESRIAMRPAAGSPIEYVASGGLVPADSRWDATVVIRGTDGIERSRTRFAFAMDATSISDGRATPPIDPALLIGGVLLLAAVLGGAFALGGGSPPRVEPHLGRAMLAVGAGTAGVLGLVILAAGPRP